MLMRNFSIVHSIVAGAALLAFLAGCGSDNGPAAPDAAANGAAPVAETDAEHDHGQEGEHNLDGWWCVEHGVPEEECAQCDSSLVAEFKAKGDWCEKHNRPESQCFLCDASRFEKFAARYEAKFGKRPTQPTE